MATADIGRRVYLGIFLVALSTLMYEVLLTRIFSVTLWYHFAFMAVSIAMFGITVGALVVYLKADWFPQDKLGARLSLISSWFALTIVLSAFGILCAPELANNIFPLMPVPVAVVSCYIIALIPFIFSGLSVSLILTHFAKDADKLYGADLLGAATGCVAVIGLLSALDALSLVFVVALLASGAALVFAFGGTPAGYTYEAGTDKVAVNSGSLISGKFTKGLALMASFFITAGLIAQSNAALPELHPLKITWVKFAREPKPLFEKWNSFSRITVLGDPTKPWFPFAWGLSPAYKDPEMLDRLDLHIDGNARTVMTRLTVPPQSLQFPKYDMVNLAHHMRPNSDVCVVGVGSGRDILSALCFQQKSVTGVEVNDVILTALTKNFGEFSGHLDKFPQVKLVNNEARSYLAQSGRHFDIIQLSLIDTLAAGAAGAFSLAENSLYTKDGWLVFLRSLNDDGILTVTRWYHRDMPAETYRIVSLAHEALKEMGVSDTRSHILLAKCKRPKLDIDFDVATILVSPKPFDQAQQEHFKALCKDMQFDLLLTADTQDNAIFAALAEGKPSKELDSEPYNVVATTDDSPYFFQMLKFDRLFDPSIWSDKAENHALRQYGNAVAVISLIFLLGAVSLLTAGAIFLPLFIVSRRQKKEESGPKQVFSSLPALSIYFLCLGLAFMFIEVSQMSRLIVLLGHPVYGLSVVLFALLLSSGVGSLSTTSISNENLAKESVKRLIALIVVATLIGLITPWVVTYCQRFDLPIRIASALALLVPLGLFLGMAMPLGLKAANWKNPSLIPFLWGINGAASVLGSVLCVLISIWGGLFVSYAIGVAIYVVALLAFKQSVTDQSDK